MSYIYFPVDHRYDENDLEQELMAAFTDEDYDPELVTNSDIDDLAEFVNDRLLDAYHDAISDFFDLECERWERGRDNE